VRYTTELTRPVWFYVRGEEYSAQIDHFVHCINTGSVSSSTFRSASDTVLVAAMLRQDAEKPRTAIAFNRTANAAHGSSAEPRRQKSFVRSFLDRL
jgi:hypothetical protein